MESFDSSLSVDVPEAPEIPGANSEHRKSRFQSMVRSFAQRCGIWLLLAAPIQGYAAGATGPLDLKNNLEVGDGLLEAILQSPEKVVASHQLVASLSGSELAGVGLDASSRELYRKVFGGSIPDGYTLTQSDFELLLQVEISDRGDFVNSGQEFIRLQNEFHNQNGNGFSVDIAYAYRDMMTTSGFFEWAGDYIYGSAGSNGPISEADIPGIMARMAEVMNKMLGVSSDIEKIAFAAKFGPRLLAVGDQMQDPRATVDAVWQSFAAVNKSAKSSLLDSIGRKPGNYRPAWVSSMGGNHMGHYDVLDMQGNRVLRGIAGRDGVSIVYVDITGNVVCTVPIAGTGARTAATNPRSGGWLGNLLSAVRVNVDLVGHISGGVVVSGYSNRGGTGWGPSSVRWQQQTDWRQADFGWRAGNNGLVYNLIMNSTVAQREASNLIKYTYKAGRQGADRQKPKQGTGGMLSRQSSGAGPIQPVKGNAPGGRSSW